MTEGQHPEYSPPPPTVRPRPQPPSQYPPAPAYHYPPPPPGYGYPQANDRSGAAIGAAVIAFILSGFLVLAAVILIEGAALIGTLSDKDPQGTEFTIDGLINLGTAALLITAGVGLIGRKPSARTLLFAGAAIVVVEGIYWFGRFANGALFFWDCLFVVPAIIAAALTASSAKPR